MPLIQTVMFFNLIMNANSCRKCGEDMNVNNSCHICKRPIEYVCNKCNTYTDKEIHSKCIVKEKLIKTGERI